MKYFAVIGNPVEHSLSPTLHNFVFDALGIDANYKKIMVAKSDLSKITNQLKSESLHGINVSIPFKSLVSELVDIVNPRADQIGAINVISKFENKLIGNNTDWYGFVKLLEMNQIEVANKEVLVLGAGGVANAICFALVQDGVKSIKVFNRSEQRSLQFKSDSISQLKLADVEKHVNSSSIIINCTSVGMIDNTSLIHRDLLHKNQSIIDTIYTPLKTKLLCDAEQIGSKIVSGLDMFIFQGLASLDLWFGESISSKVNFNELKQHLESKLC
jgi:shikimate dehydrogenase